MAIYSSGSDQILTTTSTPLFANSTSSLSSTVTSAGVTILTAASDQSQMFTGTQTQIVNLPDPATLHLGQSYRFINKSTDVVSVNTVGNADTVQQMASETSLVVICIASSGSTAAAWQAYYNPLAPFEFPLAVDLGGTGLSSYTQYSLVYAPTTTSLASLAPAANGILLTNASGIPSIGNSVGADVSFNSVRVGRGNSGVSTNTVVGSGAGSAFTSGNHNTAMGWSSLDGVTTGANNTGYGYSSGISGATGAVTLTTGSANTFIGYRAAADANDASDVIAIGADAVAPKAAGGNGPGIAIGSDAHRVGFDNAGLIYSGGTGRGYWRPTINGTAYFMPLFIDGTLTASAAMVTDENGSPILSSAMTDGQLIIGSTSATPVAANLTAGAGVSITNGAGSITIAASGGGFTYNVVSGTSQTAVAANAYILNNAGATTVTLPATASSSVGDTVKIKGRSAAAWVIQAAAGQTITMGSASSSVAGTLTASAGTDSIQLVYVAADEWSVDWAMTDGVIVLA